MLGRSPEIAHDDPGVDEVAMDLSLERSVAASLLERLVVDLDADLEVLLPCPHRQNQGPGPLGTGGELTEQLDDELLGLRKPTRGKAVLGDDDRPTLPR